MMIITSFAFRLSVREWCTSLPGVCAFTQVLTSEGIEGPSIPSVDMSSIEGTYVLSIAAWMSGPLAYLSFPQTFAPSHKA